MLMKLPMLLILLILLMLLMLLMCAISRDRRAVCKRKGHNIGKRDVTR